VQLVALAIALAACVTDIRSRRIPNVLTFGGALAGIVFHVVTGGIDGLILGSSGWIVGGLVFFIPFALGGLGAGDVKLLGALGAWLGPMAIVWVALYTGIAGGIAAVAVALARGYLSQAFKNIYLLLMHWRVAGVRPLHEVTLAGSKGPRLAYAVPILCGLLATFWLE
jgi:prepilin peptidase CpaA